VATSSAETRLAGSAEHQGHYADLYGISRLACAAGSWQAIAWCSRFGHNIETWALFEPFDMRPESSSPIDLSHLDLDQALAIHHLDIDAAGRRSL
jgi:hypothetical protein